VLDCSRGDSGMEIGERMMGEEGTEGTGYEITVSEWTGRVGMGIDDRVVGREGTERTGDETTVSEWTRRVGKGMGERVVGGEGTERTRDETTVSESTGIVGRTASGIGRVRGDNKSRETSSSSSLSSSSLVYTSLLLVPGTIGGESVREEVVGEGDLGFARFRGFGHAFSLPLDPDATGSNLRTQD
jgi:hypothetical protein